MAEYHGLDFLLGGLQMLFLLLEVLLAFEHAQVDNFNCNDSFQLHVVPVKDQPITPVSN